MIVKEVSTKGLRLVHFEQLMEYIYSVEEEGSYWGPKKHFDKRHKELKGWLKRIIAESTELKTNTQGT